MIATDIVLRLSQTASIAEIAFIIEPMIFRAAINDVDSRSTRFRANQETVSTSRLTGILKKKRREVNTDNNLQRTGTVPG